MSAQRPWARHYQDEWHNRAGDPRLPHWLRVAALAYGSHQENGHAPFKRGEIALILGSFDTATGEIRPYANVGRAIEVAIEYGWLAEGSYWRCLVVPAHVAKKGNIGRAKPCPIHIKRNAKPSLSERLDVHTSTLSERFEARTTHSVSDSPRNRLSLICPPEPTDTAGSSKANPDEAAS